MKKINATQPLEIQLHQKNGKVCIFKGNFSFDAEQSFLETNILLPQKIDLYIENIKRTPKHEIDIVLGERQSGKTSEVFQKAREDKNLSIIVPNTQHKNRYPADLRDRIKTIKQLSKYSKNNLIIDEPEFIDYNELKSLDENKIVMIVGSPVTRFVGEKSWFKEMCEKYGYRYKKSFVPDYRRKELSNIVSMPTYLTEYNASFVFVPKE